MTVTLLHPSRQRAAVAEACVQEWRSRATGDHVLEHILSVDADDPQLEAYRALAARLDSRLVVGDNRTMVEAVNRGATHATGDVIVSISDDFGCPDRWDAGLAGLIAGRSRAALLVHDGIDGRIMTLPILTRAWYEELGYIYHPQYISMFADDDLTEVSRQAGVLIDARLLTFPHRHANVGLSAADETHSRQNSNRSWWHGWRTFRHRSIDCFGDRRRDPRSRLAHAQVEAYYLARTFGARLRRLWRPLLPPALRKAESSVRDGVLRIIERITTR